MIRSVRAIVRDFIPGCLDLSPGCVVRVSSLAIDHRFGLRFPASPETSPDLLFWVDPKYLLAYDQFLKKEPLTDYWLLIFERSVINNDPNRYISHLFKQSEGCHPHRFESFGEAMCYVKYFELDPEKFQLAHVKQLKSICDHRKDKHS